MAEIQISTRLTGFQRAAKSVNRLGDSFKRMGNKVRAAARVFVTRILPAIAAAGAAILALGNKFRTAFRDIAVSTGAIGKKLDGLKDDFRAILKTGPDSFKAVADAVGTLNTFLGLTGKPLQKLSRQILDLSRLLGDEAGPNTLLFAKALNQFNEPVKNASLILDQLFKITQDTGIAFGELLNQVLRQGPAFAPLNLSLIQVADLMGRFNKAGLRTRSLGPALLAFFAKAGKASKKTGEGLKDAAAAAGIAATNFRSLTSTTKSLLERSRALAAGIGQTAEGVNKAAESMKGVGKALQTPTEAFEAIVRKIARTGDKLKQLNIAAEAFGVDAAGVIVEAIRKRIIPALDELGKPLENAAGLIKKTTDDTRTLGEVWGQVGNDIATAFEPAALALDKFARESVPRLKRNTDRLASFVAFLVEFGSRASDALGSIFDAIKPSAIGNLLNETFPLWKSFIEGLISLFGQLASFIGEKFQQIGAIIGEALASLLKIDFGAAIAKTLNFIVGTFKIWKTNVVSIVSSTVQEIRSWLVDRFNSIVASITRAINRMVNAFRRARKAISSGSIVPDLVSEIGKEFKKLDTPWS
ncbi:MAG: phage tail tape measure protein, partial [Proteobacteria bacterium]|nr:phage tail tape measure protein [Pseudomonadota bacterium]